MDFLILYESIERGELENACILKCILEKQGYSVKIEYFRAPRKYFYHPEVVIVPCLYNEQSILEYCKYWRKKRIKVLNLQYEQVLTDKNIQTGFYTPKEGAEKAVHIAWGDNTVKRLIQGGVPKTRVIRTGHISMDLNHKSFDPLFLTKNQVSEQYGLPFNQRWNLFISNFVYTKKAIVEDSITRLGEDSGLRDMYRLTVQSRNLVLEWMKKAMKELPDQIFIYRPHPAEARDKIWEELEQEFQNFRYIGDSSVRQWIRVSDNLSIWWSTSIMDAYFAGKGCSILRPVPIDKSQDSVMMKNAAYIISYEEYINSLKREQKSEEFPIEKSCIEDYYGEYRDGKNFYRVTEVCRKLKDSDEFLIECSHVKYKGNKTKRFLMNIILELERYLSLSKIMPRKYKYQLALDEKQLHGALYKEKRILKNLEKLKI